MKTLVALLVALGLSGCVVVPAYDGPYARPYGYYGGGYYYGPRHYYGDRHRYP